MSSLMQAKPLDPHAVKAMLSDGRELALIDLREELIFSRNHLLWARSIPLSRLAVSFSIRLLTFLLMIAPKSCLLLVAGCCN